MLMMMIVAGLWCRSRFSSLLNRQLLLQRVRSGWESWDCCIQRQRKHWYFANRLWCERRCVSIAWPDQAYQFCSHRICVTVLKEKQQLLVLLVY